MGALQLLRDYRKRQVVAEFPVPGSASVAQVVESAIQGQPYALGEVQPATRALSPSTSQSGAFCLRCEAMTPRNRMRYVVYAIMLYRACKSLLRMHIFSVDTT